jgi:hypothetical protein
VNFAILAEQTVRAFAHAISNRKIHAPEQSKDEKEAGRSPRETGTETACRCWSSGTGHPSPLNEKWHP